MTVILGLLGPFLPYIIAGLTALIGGAGYVWNAKRKAKNEGIAQQQAKEAAANAQEMEIIKSAAGVKPSIGLSDDPSNRDNAKG